MNSADPKDLIIQALAAECSKYKNALKRKHQYDDDHFPCYFFDDFTLWVHTGTLARCNRTAIQLLKTFKKYGDVEEVFFPPGKRFAKVRMRHLEDVDEATKDKSNLMIDGIPIHVRRFKRF